MTTQADLLLNEMRSHLGLTGRPNLATRWYAMGHGSEYLDAAWCDMFLSFCASKAKIAGVVGEFALCQSHLNWFKRLGLADMKPAKGAIVFFDWDDDNWADHVGVVESVRADGSFYTIEGNTSDSVARRHRFLRDVQGFGHPAYLTVAPAYPGKLLIFAEQNNGYIWQNFLKVLYRHRKASADLARVGAPTLRRRSVSDSAPPAAMMTAPSQMSSTSGFQ